MTSIARYHHRATLLSYGFTLLEISIVLVILGLLIAGVLVGQDLVRAAGERSSLAQLDKFNTAVIQFKDRYRYLPGDFNPSNSMWGNIFPARSGGQGRGDQDDKLETSWNFNSTHANVCGEMMLFWTDLYIAGLIEETSALGTDVVYPNCFGAVLYPDGNLPLYLPRGKMDNTFWAMAPITAGQHYYVTATFPSMNTQGSGQHNTYSIPVVSAYNLDTKIDDGIPTSGKVRSARWDGTTDINAELTSTQCDTGDVYPVTEQSTLGRKCNLAFKAPF